MILVPLLARAGQRPILSRATALMGFVGMLIVYTCQNLGLSYTGAANAAIIHGGIPVFTVLIAAPAISERLDRKRLVGIGLSMAGVTAVVLGEAISLVQVTGGVMILLGVWLVTRIAADGSVQDTAPAPLQGVIAEVMPPDPAFHPAGTVAP